MDGLTVVVTGTERVRGRKGTAKRRRGGMGSVKSQRDGTGAKRT